MWRTASASKRHSNDTETANHNTITLTFRTELQCEILNLVAEQVAQADDTSAQTRSWHPRFPHEPGLTSRQAPKPAPTPSDPATHVPRPVNWRPAAKMGITDFFSDVWDTFSHPSPDAEAPPQGGTSTDTPASGTDEESKEEADVNKKDAASSGDGEQGHRPSEGGDDEEEEEEETVDPKETLEKGESTDGPLGSDGQMSAVDGLLGCLNGLFGDTDRFKEMD